MDSKSRRKCIVKSLKESEEPIKGTELANIYNVSRQVIVQDIAILRAAGEKIIATPQGYMMMNEKKDNKIIKAIVCKHFGYDEIEDELKTIVDLGGKVLDVIVDHPLYGEIKSSLMINSRIDIQKFMDNLYKEKAEPLASLTEGVHIHNIELPNEETYERIKDELFKKGYLINTK